MDFDIISLDNDLKKKLKDDARRPILEKNVAQIDELLRRPDQSESELLAAREQIVREIEDRKSGRTCICSKLSKLLKNTPNF